MNFEIKEDFLINGEKTKLISGAVHYFRIAPTHWKRTLTNLKAMGANCVETYIPWNLHEAEKGKFNFSGLADLEGFLTLAQELDLYIILRPTPYICAEWDFGGLPGWLLKDGNMRVRSQYPEFLQAVRDYFTVLIPKLLPFQFTEGGKVLMMQVENEYGSYGEDKTYLKFFVDLMKELGVTVPLFTSDGGWKEVLDAGTLPEENIFATVNFGSKADENFDCLLDYQRKHHLKQPQMCMEFWDGWFNTWNDPIIRRDPKETSEEVRAILKRGSINFYMFQGGTNFGFYNGTSDNGETNAPQITSYDYDAPINEWGAPTEKFYAIQKVIQEMVPEAKTFAPEIPEPKNIGTFNIENSVSLFSVLDDLATPVFSDYTLPMEKIDQNYGYLLYRSHLKEKREIKNFKLVDCNDRAQIFVNEKHLATKYLENMKEPLTFTTTEEENQLDILVENVGRNNYGPKLVADTQRKGIRSGVMEDIHYIANWEHYSLPLDNVSKIDFTKESIPNTPSFYKTTVRLDEAVDTFLDCSNLGKGVVFVNGHNLGRFWEIGPVTSLYIPDYFWQAGENEVIIFATEGKEITEINFTDHPLQMN